MIYTCLGGTCEKSPSAGTSALCSCSLADPCEIALVVPRLYRTQAQVDKTHCCVVSWGKLSKYFGYGHSTEKAMSNCHFAAPQHKLQIQSSIFIFSDYQNKNPK